MVKSPKIAISNLPQALQHCHNALVCTHLYKNLKHIANLNDILRNLHRLYLVGIGTKKLIMESKKSNKIYFATRKNAKMFGRKKKPMV